MSSNAGIRAGDRAFVKVGRNLVEVRVNGRAEGGWNVTSRTGKAMTAKTLLTADGETLAAGEAEVSATAKAAPAKAKASGAKATSVSAGSSSTRCSSTSRERTASH